MENLNALFNIEPTQTTGLVLPSSNREDDKDDDYQLARQTLRKLIIKGEDTLDEMINLAKNSEHPRTYEVAGQLIKTMSDVAKDLLSLQKQIKDIDTPSKNQGQIGNQTNNVFVGSTDELLKLLKKEDGKTIEQR
ncbi:MAG: terminase small subunit [Minisyncoccia bacterium]